jgi:hypothetical protein
MLHKQSWEGSLERVQNMISIIFLFLASYIEMTNVIFIRVYSMTSSICFSKQSWEGSQREGTANMIPLLSFLALPILIYTV